MTAYTYDGGTGAFDAVGAIMGGVKQARTLANDWHTRRSTVASKFPNASMHELAPLYAEIDRTLDQLGQAQVTLIQSAVTHLIETVDDEDPIENKGSIKEMVERLIDFMEADNKVFSAPAVGSSTAVSGTGTGNMIVGTKNVEGNTLTQIRAEDVIAECVEDAQGPGTIVAGEERFTLKGEMALPRTDREWPGGSGIVATIYSTHGGHDQSSRVGRNRLRNGDFEQFTANDPDYWTIEVGVAGTDIDDSTNALRGSKSLKWTGDGATLSKVNQALDDTDGVSLRANAVYAVSLWVKAVSAAPAAGVMKVSLQNSADTVVDDDQAAALSFNIDLTTITTSWVLYSGTFSTPKDLLAFTGLKLAIELTTAITNTNVVETDEVVLQEMWHPQPGGPYFAIVAGATNWAVQDTITATMTNDWADDEWIREIDRAANTYDFGLVPPTSSTGNISDSLIA